MNAQTFWSYDRDRWETIQQNLNKAYFENILFSVLSYKCNKLESLQSISRITLCYSMGR